MFELYLYLGCLVLAQAHRVLLMQRSARMEMVHLQTVALALTTAICDAAASRRRPSPTEVNSRTVVKDHLWVIESRIGRCTTSPDDCTAARARILRPIGVDGS